MIVIDASALAAALIDDGPLGERARELLRADSRWAAPSHLLVEVVSVIRGRVLGGKLSEQRGADAIAALREIVVDYIDTAALLDRMWQLRSNVSSYDASYIAAAEILGCPLLTADLKLTRATGTWCSFQPIEES